MRHIEAQRIAELLIDAPQLLTTEEVASLLRVNTATVIRWTQEQRLLSIKVGPRLHRFPKATIEKRLQDAALSKPNN